MSTINVNNSVLQQNYMYPTIPTYHSNQSFTGTLYLLQGEIPGTDTTMWWVDEA